MNREEIYEHVKRNTFQLYMINTIMDEITRVMQSGGRRAQYIATDYISKLLEDATTRIENLRTVEENMRVRMELPDPEGGQDGDD